MSPYIHQITYTTKKQWIKEPIPLPQEHMGQVICLINYKIIQQTKEIAIKSKRYELLPFLNDAAFILKGLHATKVTLP